MHNVPYATPLLPERLWLRTEPTSDGHWLWRGYIMSNGYGQASKGGLCGMALAHRLFYERLVGPIPADLEIDHLCRTRNCVNPAHLEAVTHAVNMSRTDAGIRGSLAAAKRQLSKKACQYGHRFAGDNLYFEDGKRRCRECKRANRRDSHARHKDLINARRRSKR